MNQVTGEILSFEALKRWAVWFDREKPGVDELTATLGQSVAAHPVTLDKALSERCAICARLSDLSAEAEAHYNACLGEAISGQIANGVPGWAGEKIAKGLCQDVFLQYARLDRQLRTCIEQIHALQTRISFLKAEMSNAAHQEG